MSKKIFKYLNSAKFINIMSYTFCIIYFFYAISFAVLKTNNENQKIDDFNRLLVKAQSYNAYLEENISTETPKDEVEDIKPLFTDGKTAFITAYNNTIYSSSFFVDSTSVNTINARGFTLKMNGRNLIAKYSEDKMYELSVSQLVQTDAGSAITSIIQPLATSARQKFYENDQIKMQETESVYIKDNVYYGDFNKSSVQNKTLDEVPLIAQNLYVVNEETVSNITYFNIKYIRGVPKYYYVQAELDPVKSTVNYAKVLKFAANALELPKYSKVVVSLIINDKGHVIAMTMMDTISYLKVNILGGTTATGNFTQDLILTKIGEEVNYEVS